MKQFLHITVFAAILAIFNVGIFAANISVGTVSRAPGETAVVPVTVTNDFDEVSMLSFIIDAGTTLPMPEAVRGPDQSNIQQNHCFVDDLGNGLYRVMAFIVNTPNIAFGDGHTVDLQFDLSEVPEDTYPLSVTSTKIFNIFGAELTGDVTDGAITVDINHGTDGWMLY